MAVSRLAMKLSKSLAKGLAETQTDANHQELCSTNKVEHGRIAAHSGKGVQKKRASKR